MSCEGYVNELYNYEDKDNKKVKNFSFAVHLKKFNIQENEITIQQDGQVEVIFSTCDYLTLLHLQNGLLKIFDFQYKNYHLQIKRIFMMQESLPLTNTAVFKTLSPIVVRSKEGKYLSIEDCAYEKSLNYICNEIIRSIHGRDLYELLQFRPIEMKKVIVKLKHKAFQNLNEKSLLYVLAHKGIFELKGDPIDLAILTQVGAGFRRSESFGCLEYIENRF